MSGGNRAGLGWGLRGCRGPVPAVPRGGGYGHGRLREALGGCAWERRGCCLRPVPLPKAKRDRRELEAPGREAGVWLARGWREAIEGRGNARRCRERGCCGGKGLWPRGLGSWADPAEP